MSKRPLEDEIRLGDVRVDWDLILPGLRVIKDGGNCDWRVEDIYTMCRNEEAYAYMFEGGFAIVQRTQNPLTLEIELHFHAVYSEMKGSCLKYIPFFEALASEVGATSLTMESDKNIFEKYGWEVDHIRYKRSLP